MKTTSIATAQHGIALADVDSRRRRALGVPKKRSAAARKRLRAARAAAASFTGPFLSPGSLTADERVRLIDGIAMVLEGVYTHLPLKRARYGFDPIQRLRILRTQVSDLTDDAFHSELADIVTRLRDAHTRYTGPASLEGKVAVLPFLVEMIGSATAPMYLVTKVGRGLDPSFKPGVILEYWNAVPIDRAVQTYSDREVGGRPDTQRAWALQSLTLRALQYGPPPDEHWVVVGYRTSDTGPSKEIKIPWQIVDPSQIARTLPEGATGKKARALRLTRAVNPAAEAVRRAKMLLFAPKALVGQQTRAPRMTDPTSKRGRATTASVIPTRLTETLKATSIDAPGGPFGYLRIYGFDSEPDAFINELLRLIPLLPDRGLVIDVRGNPGGYIWAAEVALQLFTPNRIEPTRFSALATAFTRTISSIGSLVEELGPWHTSLEAAVRNGELYAQPVPLTDVEACNELGQQYGGPVVLVADSTTYSSGDLFSAGFVDNAIGPFLCVGSATGAGGANVWNYADLRKALAGSPAALPALPDGIDLSFAFRRATRAGPSEGLTIEDVGVQGTTYAITRDDLLYDNRDLIAKCVALLKQQPFSSLTTKLDPATRTIQVSTSGLDRLDTLIDTHPGTSQKIGAKPKVSISYPASAKLVELVGFSGADVRQRRRIRVSR